MVHGACKFDLWWGECGELDREFAVENQEGYLMWAVIETGMYQHIFTKLDKPYKMQGQLIQWASICGRSFAIKEPQPNPKKLKCIYCEGKGNGNHNSISSV